MGRKQQGLRRPSLQLLVDQRLRLLQRREGSDAGTAKGWNGVFGAWPPLTNFNRVSWDNLITKNTLLSIGAQGDRGQRPCGIPTSTPVCCCSNIFWIAK